MTFRVGQRVVCVDASCRPGYDWKGRAPKEGSIYTVVGFSKPRIGDYDCIVLAEISHPWGYRASRFRPIVERKTSIEVFQRMLNPSEVKA